MTSTSWQTLLFVPVGAERHLASAIRHRPDAVILDLEDAVAIERKDDARGQLRSMQTQIRHAGLDCVLRVNRPLRQMVRDFEAADFTALAAVMVPKCDSAGVLANAAEVLADLAGSASRPGLIALVETPGAVPRIGEIAAAPGLIAMMLGSEDYCAALGVSPEEGALEIPAGLLAAACAAHGLLPIGLTGSIANYQDLERYGRNLTHARQLGFRAVAAVHPAQLPVISEKLAPSVEEIAWASKIISAAEQSTSAVIGSAHGMIDAPVIARARAILVLAAKSSK